MVTKEGLERTTKSRVNFLEWEKQYVVQNKQTKSNGEIAFALNRSIPSVEGLVKNLRKDERVWQRYAQMDNPVILDTTGYIVQEGRGRVQYTEYEKAYVLQYYNDVSVKEMSRGLKRTSSSIRTTMSKMRINPTETKRLMQVDCTPLIERFNLCTNDNKPKPKKSVQRNQIDNPHYQEWEKYYIAQNNTTKTVGEIAYALERTYAGISNAIKRMRRDPGEWHHYQTNEKAVVINTSAYVDEDDHQSRHYTEQEKAFIVQYYQPGYIEEMAESMGRSASNIRQLAWRIKQDDKEYERLYAIDCNPLINHLGLLD